ncbi:hypothetical protein RFI_30494 [Reticulomyxa filosa]|uniref:Uncharacterized protein n=1 Tax=Reticulomyxa filosa TaxID=46433 RepID=X6M1R9_RETFI|nr:hypothetical protein RFI_30494 [Reticulomyxa filosa]|eukprot:ETO06900.1 hypothetical protein RFI_30494 [Reticulomyxa filosa]
MIKFDRFAKYLITVLKPLDVKDREKFIEKIQFDYSNDIDAFKKEFDLEDSSFCVVMKIKIFLKAIQNIIDFTTLNYMFQKTLMNGIERKIAKRFKSHLAIGILKQQLFNTNEKEIASNNLFIDNFVLLPRYAKEKEKEMTTKEKVKVKEAVVKCKRKLTHKMALYIDNRFSS